MKELVSELGENLERYRKLSKFWILRYYFVRHSITVGDLVYFDLTNEDIEELTSEAVLRLFVRLRSRKKAWASPRAQVTRELRGCAWKAWANRSKPFLTTNELERENEERKNEESLFESLCIETTTQAQVVGAALSLGITSPTELSKALGISRRTIYRTYNELRELNHELANS